MTDRFTVTPDGRSVLFIADANSAGRLELFVTPIGGGTPRTLNASLVPAGNVVSFAISPDSRAVVYLADQRTDELFELFGVPIDAGPATRLSGELIDAPANTTRYSWPAQPGAASYEVKRSGRPDFSADCVSVSGPDPFWDDPELPAPARLFHYLNRPLSPHVGSWGTDSSGTDRPVPCL